MPRRSAGVLAYRLGESVTEVLLAHPGGPYWAKKDEGNWSIPKGEYDDSESPEQAARREFAEETGFEVGAELIDLGVIRQPSGKLVHAFAAEKDLDAAAARSNLFPLEWPPHSGRIEEFPEVDRVEWFSLDAARLKILRGQAAFLDRLEDAIHQK